MEGFALTENCLKLVALDMADATAEELAPAEDYSGEYLIITKYKEEGWYYMTNQNTDNKDYEQGATIISSSSNFNTLSKDDFSSIENIEDNLWIISKFNDGYSVNNAASQQYITLGGSNRTAGISTEETTLYITK